MAVLQCGGCDRFISMSAVPGGNPVALADPERWSVTRTVCPGCNRSLCDRCAPRSASHCPLCRASLAQVRETAAEDEDDEAAQAAWAVQAALKDARRWLLAASAGAVVCAFLFLATKSIGITMVTWVATFMAAWSGTQRLVAAGGAARFWSMVAPVIMFMPMLNIVPLAWLAWRAHAQLAELDEALRAREARAAARERARRRAAAAPPAATARPAPPPAVTAAATAASDVRRAVAYVKMAGLGEVADGTVLQVSLTGEHAGQMPAQDGPVLVAYQGFGVFFALDQGEHLSLVNQDQAAAAGLTPQALLQLGLRNLAQRVNDGKPGLSMRPNGPIQALLMDGSFEASLVLLDDLWEGPLKPHAPNGVVMAVPARDICAFCDAASAEGVAELRALVARVTDGGDHLIAPNLYARRNGRWAELA